MLSRNIKTAVIVAIVVGTILNTINSYDVILEGNFTFRNVVKIILTYITPFCVSLYSSTKATKSFNNTNLKPNPVTEK
jgi:type III secretory pathway component EscS